MAELIVTTPGRTRLRRLRRTRVLRNLVAETNVGADNLTMPPIGYLKCSISLRSAPTLRRLCSPRLAALLYKIVFSSGETSRPNM